MSPRWPSVPRACERPCSSPHQRVFLLYKWLDSHLPGAMWRGLPQEMQSRVGVALTYTFALSIEQLDSEGQASMCLTCAEVRERSYLSIEAS